MASGEVYVKWASEELAALPPSVVRETGYSALGPSEKSVVRDMVDVKVPNVRAFVLTPAQQRDLERICKEKAQALKWKLKMVSFADRKALSKVAAAVLAAIRALYAVPNKAKARPREQAAAGSARAAGRTSGRGAARVVDSADVEPVVPEGLVAAEGRGGGAAAMAPSEDDVALAAARRRAVELAQQRAAEADRKSGKAAIEALRQKKKAELAQREKMVKAKRQWRETTSKTIESLYVKQHTEAVDVLVAKRNRYMEAAGRVAQLKEERRAALEEAARAKAEAAFMSRTERLSSAGVAFLDNVARLQVEEAEAAEAARTAAAAADAAAAAQREIVREWEAERRGVESSVLAEVSLDLSAQMADDAQLLLALEPTVMQRVPPPSPYFYEPEVQKNETWTSRKRRINKSRYHEPTAHETWSETWTESRKARQAALVRSRRAASCDPSLPRKAAIPVHERLFEDSFNSPRVRTRRRGAAYLDISLAVESLIDEGPDAVAARPATALGLPDFAVPRGLPSPIPRAPSSAACSAPSSASPHPSRRRRRRRRRSNDTGAAHRPQSHASHRASSRASSHASYAPSPAAFDVDLQATILRMQQTDVFADES